jgi:hypothetical protein
MKDALLQASPEKFKKQQQDADRAMKEILEVEQAAADSKKKHVKTGNAIRRKCNGCLAVEAALKNKFEDPGEEEVRKQEAAEKEADHAAVSQVIKGHELSQEKDDNGLEDESFNFLLVAKRKTGDQRDNPSETAARKGAESNALSGAEQTAASIAALGPAPSMTSADVATSEGERLFMSKFNWWPLDTSSEEARTAGSTTALGPAAVPEGAPSPAESMSQAAPAAAPKAAPAPAITCRELRQQEAVPRFVSDSFQCPLTMEVMRDPVMTTDGQTYERTEIERWFALGNRTSPLTAAELPSTLLFPNIALRNAIQDAGA